MDKAYSTYGNDDKLIQILIGTLEGVTHLVRHWRRQNGHTEMVIKINKGEWIQ
jgi:hypothetical protein